MIQKLTLTNYSNSTKIKSTLTYLTGFLISFNLLFRLLKTLIKETLTLFWAMTFQKSKTNTHFWKFRPYFFQTKKKLYKISKITKIYSFNYLHSDTNFSKTKKMKTTTIHLTQKLFLCSKILPIKMKILLSPISLKKLLSWHLKMTLNIEKMFSLPSPSL